MTKSYRNFNLTCAILSAFFLLGTMWMCFVNDVNVGGVESVENVQVEQLEQLEQAPAIEQIEQTKSLPTKINLNVPFTSQAPEKDWGQPWQDACEEAALLMLDAYYKKYNLSPLFAKDEMIKMVEWEEKQGWGRSIEINKIEIILKEYLKITNSKLQITNKILNVKVIENPTIEQIKNFVANGNPVLVVADGKVLPNPHFRNGGPVYHALIIRGYDEDEFITNDPGTQFGGDFKYKYDVLMNAIHEWNGGDVKNGRKVILVIE